jgi:CRP-like cAMP-binding protein
MSAHDLPPSLGRYGVERTVRTGRALQYEDDPCVEAFYLVEGSVRPVKFATDGRPFDLLPLAPGAWIGLAELLSCGVCHFDAVASGDCRVLAFSAACLERALADELAVRAVIAALAGEIALLHHFIADEDAEGKLLSFILARRGLAGLPLERSRLVLTQSALAGAVGLTRETVNRQLRELEEKGLVTTGRGEIGIPDWARLADYANDRRK